MYDVAVGYLHQVLPGSLTGNLPPIGERWVPSATGPTYPRTVILGALDFGAWLRVAERAQDRKRAE